MTDKQYTAILLRGHTPRDWPKAGIYGCLHRAIPIEWTHDVSERIQYIHSAEWPWEQRRRCEMLRPIPGPWPENVIAAKDVFDKAMDAYNSALLEHAPALIRSYNEAYPDHPWVGPTIFAE